MPRKRDDLAYRPRNFSALDFEWMAGALAEIGASDEQVTGFASLLYRLPSRFDPEIFVRSFNIARAQRRADPLRPRTLTPLEKQLLDALAAVEWEGADMMDRPACPICGAAQDGGKHQADCQVATALKAGRGE